jgi:GNAT superfamily N-acetyltransferase
MRTNISFENSYGGIAGFVSDKSECNLWLRNQGFILDSVKLNGVIRSVYVEEQFRNQGFGTKLIDRFIRKAKSYGATDILLVADISWKQLGSFDLQQYYEKLGFQKLASNQKGLLMRVSC